MKFAVALSPWLALPFLAVAVVPAKRAEIGAAVNTTSGEIAGHIARNRTNVSEYLGIPYAQPPVGQLRFAPPQAFSSSKLFNASSYSPDCPANPAKPTLNFPDHTEQEVRVVEQFAGQAGTAQSEDCLTLNVWTKASGKKDKPVLIFLYGGRFNIGNTNTPFYNGQYLAAAEDVVIVTINYRVNIFGFPGYPGLTQNVGLLDQRLAVEWVRNNIAGFGGCPARITLFGQSAGGSSADYWSYIWKEDPIVQGLISESGTAQSFNPNTPAQSTQAFYNVSALLGCGSSGDVLPCVRSKNTNAILAAVLKVPTAPTLALPAPPFQPTIDNITIFANYSLLASQGAFTPLPYLAGNNNNEFGYYAIAVFAANKTFSPAQINLFNLEAFTCPTGAETAARAAHGVPVWRYRYFGDWPNLRLYPTSGAYHGSEIEMVFGTAQDVSLLPSTEEENMVSSYFMKVWATFAKDPREGLTRRLKWPKYDPEGKTLVRLAYEDETTVSFVRPDVYDGVCASLGGNKANSTGAF